MNSFADLEPSPYADSIYYADLFKINNRVWMITGCGKSTAAMIATNYEKTADLARDGVAIIRNNNILYGCWDIGSINKDQNKNKELHESHKIDYIAHCLTQKESEEVYSNTVSLFEIDNKHLSILLSDYEYPAFMASRLFSLQKYKWLIDPIRRFNRFIELTTGVTSIKFFIVPWMPNTEDRASLYLNYL